MEFIVYGITEVFSFSSLFVIVISVFMGISVGALPGLGPMLAVVLLIPFTLGFGPTAGILSLISVYIGGVYGGSITAILLGIPGTPMAMATLFDGYPMAKKGMGSHALGIALVASVFGGIFSSFILAFAAPVIARYALRFGPPEYFMLGILGLTTIASVTQGSTLKGLLTGAFGAFLSTIGSDLFSGRSRFNFGSSYLLGGIDLVAMLVGIYAIPEVMVQSEEMTRTMVEKVKVVLPTIKEIWKNIHHYIRSSFIGIGIGAIPGIGEVVASLVSYSVARNNTKDGVKFGEGNPVGIIASETANNACTGGALIPTLGLSIPGSPITAVLMGALILLGVSPGPRLFIEGKEIVSVIFVGLFLANIVMFIIGLAAARVFIKFSTLRKEHLIPVILLLSFLGTYSLQGRIEDVWIMWLFGIVGYTMRKTQYPVAPVVIGFVLGPLVETSFKRSMIISQSSPAIFFTRPISLVIAIVTVLLLITSAFLQKKGGAHATKT